MYAHTTIGIDLGITSKHRACAIGPDAPPRLPPIGPSPAELDALLDAVGGPDHVDVVLEPTGLSWVPVSVYLARQGACVHRVDTRKAHGFRKVLSRNVKSDRADAEALARMLLIAPDEVRPLASFDGRVFMLARLTKTRETLIDDRTQVILRIKALLSAYVPTLVPRLAERSLGPIERVLLRAFLDPRKTLDVGPKGLSAAVKAAGLDARAPKAAALIHAWIEAAEQTRALYDGALPLHIAQREIGVHLDHFDGFAPLIAAIEADIAAPAEGVGRSVRRVGAGVVGALLDQPPAGVAALDEQPVAVVADAPRQVEVRGPGCDPIEEAVAAGVRQAERGGRGELERQAPIDLRSAGIKAGGVDRLGEERGECRAAEARGRRWRVDHALRPLVAGEHRAPGTDPGG